MRRGLTGVYLVMNGAARLSLADGSVYDQAETLAEAKEKLEIYADERLCVVEAEVVDGEFVPKRLVPEEEVAAALRPQ